MRIRTKKSVVQLIFFVVAFAMLCACAPVNGFIGIPKKMGAETPSASEASSGEVTAYSVSAGIVYYAMPEGIFKFDLNLSHAERTMLFNLECEVWKFSEVLSIEIFEDVLIMELWRLGHAPDGVRLTEILDLQNGTLAPLTVPSLEELTLYKSSDFADDYEISTPYELFYPAGFVTAFDEGSYYSGRTLFSDPTTNLFITVMDYKYVNGSEYSAYIQGNELYRHDKMRCNYYFIDEENEIYFFARTEGKFHMFCYTEDGFWIEAYGPWEQLDWVFEIIRSIRRCA